MRNNKMPIYDKSNLIDFTVKTKKSFSFRTLRYPKINMLDTFFIIACLAAALICMFALYSVWK